MPTGDAYSSGHLVLSLLGLAFVLLVETSDILYRIDIILDCDIITGFNIITESDISPNIGFHGVSASATGVACQQGTLTPPPDTWSRPLGTCICSTCWDQSFCELVVILPDYALRISLGTFSILHLTSVAERSKARTFLSWTGVVWVRITLETYFHFEFFAPSPFRTGQRSWCKWNQVWPFTCSQSCFIP